MVILAILAAFLAAQKPEGIPPPLDGGIQWSRSALQAIQETAARKIKGSNALDGRNIPKMGLNPRSRGPKEIGSNRQTNDENVQMIV